MADKYSWQFTANEPTATKSGNYVTFRGVASGGSTGGRVFKILYSQYTWALEVGNDADWDNPPYASYLTSTSTTSSSYTFPATYLSTGRWYYREMYMSNGATKIFYSSGTTYIDVGSTTYSLTVTPGTGISSITGYLSTDYTTRTLYSATTFSGLASGDYFYVSSVGYESNYTYPVYGTNQAGTGTFTMINSSGSWSDHYISMPSNNRNCTVTATYSPPTTYNYSIAIKYGYYPYTTTNWYATSDSSTSTYYPFYLPNYYPTRSGYTCLGFSTTVDGSVVYTAGDVAYAVASSPNIVLYCVWQQQSYTYEVELVDGYGTTCDTLSATTTASYYDFTVPTYSSSYPTHYGYVFRTWKYGSTEYAPYSTIRCDTSTQSKTLTAQWNVDTDTFSLQLGTVTSSSITVRITGLTAKAYARTITFVCNGVTKSVTVSANSTSSSYVTFTGLSSEGGYQIDGTLTYGSLTLGSNYTYAYPLLNFAWTNIIAQGYPISNLIASDWNEYNRLLTIKAIRHSKTHSYTTVSSGTIIYATYYNAVCNSLRNINSSYNINNVSSGDQVIATPFNTMVTYLNTDDN